MIVITLKFISVVVSKYDRDGLVLRINFNDGSKDRLIEKQTNLDDVDEFTAEIISHARNAAKEFNRQQGAGFLEDVVVVRFSDDEEAVYEKLANAFRRIKEETRRLKGAKSSQNYLQNLSNIQGETFLL